jgi:nitrite reductase (NO-forming)
VSDFTLQTSMVDGRMAYVGRGGDIDGIVNPDLVVHAGAAVRVTVINGDGMPHDLSIPDLGLRTSLINNKDDSAELSFTVSETQEGTYAYFCTVSGHRQAGMEGKLLVHSNSESASITDNREKR